MNNATLNYIIDTGTEVKTLKLETEPLYSMDMHTAPYLNEEDFISHYYNRDKISKFIRENGNIIKQEKGTIYSLNNNNYGFIEYDHVKKAIYTIKDNKIEYLSDYIYYTVSDFSINNLAMVNYSSDEPYRLINIKGERINDTNYKSYRLLLDGKWVVTLEDGSNQVLNADGSILVDTFVVK